MARPFDELVNVVVDSFKDKKEPTSYNQICRDVNYVIGEDENNYFTIIKERGDIFEMLDESIADYAVDLMVNYIIGNELVEFVDSRCGLSA